MTAPNARPEGVASGALPAGGQAGRAGMLAPEIEEIVCNNVVFDDMMGMVICADNGIVLKENVIDDDVELDHVVLPRFVPYLRRRY